MRPGVFVELGRDLYAWLDGDQGQLTALLEQAARPLVFEVRATVAVGGGVGGAAGTV